MILLHGTAGQLIPLTVLIVPTIAPPIHNVNQNSISNLPYLAGLHLTHPVSSSEQATISLLIGADHYWDVVEDHIIRGNGPTAMRSKLGYLLSGPMSVVTPQGNSMAFHVSAQQPTSEPNLQQLWSMESLGISPTEESPNTFLKQYRANSIEQLPDGSYSTCFPWKESHPPFPSNFSTCVHRIRALTCKLSQTPYLLTKYQDIITDQENHGFIEKIHPTADDNRCHYFPHHGVRKDSLTTPL